jgi:hypothetical protein
MTSSGRLEERVVRQSVRFDEPTPMVGFLRSASMPPTDVQLPPASTSVPREVSEALFPAGRPEERSVRRSLRFDEPPPVAATPARQTTVAARAVDGGASVLPAVPPSPWDEHGGPAPVVDLDRTPPSSTFPGAAPRAPLPLQAPVFDQARIDTPPVPTTAAPVEGPRPANEALMTLARELFELGDFTGSLEKVEQVLQTDPHHEGARAYLQRNESTLTKMYESKLGNLGRPPRQLLRPDEVVWVNMHHRAGFVFAQVDGVLSFNDLLDVAGLKRFDAVRILADLVTRGLIG